MSATSKFVVLGASLFKGDREVRNHFVGHFHHISIGAQLRASLRAGPNAWPGGYPLFFITSDGSPLSFQSVRENLSAVLWAIRHRCDNGWRVVGCDVNWEDEDLACAHSGEQIPSAYGGQ